jgi:hypothetical protein
MIIGFSVSDKMKSSPQDRGISPAYRVAKEQMSIAHYIPQPEGRTPIDEIKAWFAPRNKERADDRSRGVARGDNSRQ